MYYTLSRCQYYYDSQIDGRGNNQYLSILPFFILTHKLHITMTMKIDFKNCDHKTPSTQVRFAEAKALENALVGWMVHNGIKEKFANSYVIRHRNNVYLDPTFARCDYAHTFASLLILLNSPGHWYTKHKDKDSGYPIVVRVSSTSSVDELLEHLDRNKDVKISICK